MALDKETVRRDLRTVMNALPELVGIPWAYENRTFKPEDVDGAWIRETLLAGGESPTATGFTQVLLQGRFDVFYPKGAGTEVPSALAKAILEALPVGTWRGAFPNQYHVYRAERFGLQETGSSGTTGTASTRAWVFAPVIFYLRAHAPRPHGGN